MFKVNKFTLTLQPSGNLELRREQDKCKTNQELNPLFQIVQEPIHFTSIKESGIKLISWALSK